MEYNIKTECVSCGNKLPNTLDYYINHGNYCPKCLSEISKKLKENKWREDKKNKFI